MADRSPLDARLVELARKGAYDEHLWGTVRARNYEFNVTGHRGAFATCPHPDCVLVRQPLSVEAQAAAWRDISTAPKDGSTIWAWDDERGSNPAVWIADADTWVITYDDAEITPRLWQPMPAAPLSGSGENEKENDNE